MILTHDMYNTIMLFGILLGALQCFFGYRLFKIIVGIIGFLIGSALAGSLSFFLSPETTIAIIVGLVGGIIGAATMLTFFYVGIFLIGTILGAIVGSVLFSIAGVNPMPIVIVVAAIISGIVALLIQKYMIIASTAFGGSWLIMAAVAYFFTRAKSPAEIEYILQSRGTLYFIILLFWIALGICGLLTQLKWFPSDLKREERDLAKYVFSDKDA